ncbi:MAG: hypothetical protein F2825_00480 [Actinobacteria bacterium]|uniref:Unannotated protein n=1 Tax=freshwater metagenome TaxID=449393 RepID=A0A6J7FTZ1_9ZZZZ|nr:hypothetical protein [Actinomycetota bacterium]
MPKTTEPVRHGHETRELTLLGLRIYRTRHTFPIDDTATPPSVQRTRARTNAICGVLLVIAAGGGAAIVPQLPL